ncbi:MAG: UDP-N-acetylmuramoyl-L-alanyl-D-glutamate--2,6-diaminopimelate ligase [Ilumatobacter sp.]|nr:UDP-N-acetylmuramoyl-L-alanyl-D-glutamate--2,6-diaminopimelate ligase [Ilumatobacter sp.]
MSSAAVPVGAILDVIGDAALDVVGDLADVAVGHVTHNSQDVPASSMFACLPGATADGHDFAGAAVAAGAAVLLVDHPLDPAVVGATPQIVVADTRAQLGPIAAVVSGNPSRQMTTVGLTGTNGKTTTSLMLAAIFEAHGWSTGVIGTLSGPRTTPEAPELQRALAGFVDAGCQAAVLEVSSHALALRRVDGTEFDAVVFTNLGHDHLDLHGTPEEYFRAKAALFAPRFAPLGVVNVDDTHGRLLADAAAQPGEFRVVGFSIDELDELAVGATTIRYRWRDHQVDVNVGGTFNVSNSLAALVVATELGIGLDVAADALRSLPTIPGRFETVASPSDESAPFTVVVDYAHTPDGLDEVISSARAVAEPGAAVVIVFGCGGDRDHAKRPEMGAAAASAADRVVITSDNPRTEDPPAIIAGILDGVSNELRPRVTSNPDRREAIREALESARPGDVVVIAGKGHEQTQDLGDRTIDFDDRVVARTLLEELS